MEFLRCMFSAFLVLTLSSSLYANSKIQIADYVIVGVGNAGAVLTKKLSDDKITSVIALHNGTNLSADPIVKLSENAVFTVLSGLIGPPLFVASATIPQINCDNRQLQWVEAVPLGGASSINAGAYCRGTNQVYSQWETIAGPLWSVNRILAIYKELENYHGLTTNPLVRGFAGPVSIRQVNDPSLISIKFTQAIINATGVPFVLDYNDPNTPIGASSQFQFTQSGCNGKFRVSSATAFLNNNVMTPSGHGVDGRKLRVLFLSPALKIIWNGNRAIGVEYLRNGKIKKVFANKSVIVCAGLLSSSFLMHSGVGPRSILEALGIPVIFDNPNVGQGLADQALLPLVFTSNLADSPFPLNEKPTLLKKEIKGILAIVQTEIGKNLFDIIINSPVKLNRSTDNGLFAQIAWLPAPGGNPNLRALRFAVANPFPGIVIALFDLVQAKSRGSISINNTNPLAPPVIDFGEFMNSEDLTVYRNGLQIYIKAINAALQAIDPQYQLLSPDPAILDNNNLVTDFIKANVMSNQCFQSHCRMAPLNQGGVVDSTGHVYGVENLIVADDSIVPVPMDGTPMATAYLIAANIGHILLDH